MGVHPLGFIRLVGFNRLEQSLGFVSNICPEASVATLDGTWPFEDTPIGQVCHMTLFGLRVRIVKTLVVSFKLSFFIRSALISVR